MYWWVRIYPSILQLYSPQLNNTQYTHLKGWDAAVLYAAFWYSAVLMKRALWDPVTHIYDTLVHLIAVQFAEEQNLLHHCSTIWITTTHPHQHRSVLQRWHNQNKFPSAPLDDDVWLEDQIADRHLYVHDTSHLNHLCHYTCPYTNLIFARNLPPSLTVETAEFGYVIMDLINADFEDIISTTSDEDILDFEDISDDPDSSQLEVWFA